jgi:hypothetical protein
VRARVEKVKTSATYARAYKFITKWTSTQDDAQLSGTLNKCIFLF